MWHLAGRQVDQGPFRPVTTLIEEQCDRTPDRPAVTFCGAPETTLTYAEFDALANGLAADLAGRGVRRGDLVPTVVGNSPELPVCMVALMKLGAAFTLCDPAWPEERLQTVLASPRPPLVLTTGAGVVDHPAAHVVRVHDIIPGTHRPGPAPDPDSPAYGVFTSGSTGTPKCAVNLHRGLTNRLRFMARWFGATGDEVVLQNSRHTFDSAIWQLLWPLTTGGRTVVPEQGEFLDLERTVDTVHRHRVTVTDFVPAILAMLLTALEASPGAARKVASLRHLVVGGEEIVPHAVHRLRELVPGLEITNGYGPSEAAIGMVFHRVTREDGDHIPLGRPIDNCYAVVTDDSLAPLPAGRTGEIVIGGACVGAGYLADPAATAEVFVANPLPAVPGGLLYRTGDLGWFDEAGLLRFAGRRDQQIKVDGVRIEPAEIEAAAESCPGVIQAKAFTVRRGTRNRLLVAAAAEDGITATRLRAHLVSLLPRIQVPQHCFVLPSLPLTENGKADLKALRRIVAGKLDAAPRAAGTADGSPAGRIAAVMRDVLGLPEFGVDDDFAAHGGDSLNALGVTLAVREALGLPAGIADVYAYGTPTALAAALLARAARPDGAAGASNAPDAPGAVGAAGGTGTGHRTGTAEAGPQPGPACDLELMERDARLPADLAAAARRAAAQAVPSAGHASPEQPRTVLVTGATGFVGARVVHQLLAQRVPQVVCAVRARDDTHARSRVVGVLRAHGLWEESMASHLEVRRADLAAPQFGWPDAVWDRYTDRCDAVLHAGALVNFLLDYRGHRAANVRGTLHVLQFALAGRPKALHHVSTLGVLQEHAARARGPVGEDTDLGAAVRPVSGYSRSKWVAERLVLAAAELGAPATVYRLGEIMPAADNGVPNPRALTHLLLSAFHQLGTGPDVPMRTDWTPVDETAARLVAGLTGPPARRVCHVFRAHTVDLVDLADLADLTDPGGPGGSAGPGSPESPGGTGGPGGRGAVDRVPPAEFMARLRAAAACDAASPAARLAALLCALPATGPGGAVDFGELLADNPRLFGRDAGAALDRQHGLRDAPLDAAFTAYRATLSS